MQMSVGSALKLTAVLAPFAALSANAAVVYTVPTPLSTIPYTSTVTDAPGAFDDIFSFTIGSGNDNASFAAVTLSLPNPFGSGDLLGISGFAGTLFNCSTNVGSLTYDGKQYNLNGTFPSGPSNLYTLELTGNAIGTAGGTYTLAMAAAPVPEPSTAMAAIAGLGLLTLVLRRRRQDEV